MRSKRYDIEFLICLLSILVLLFLVVFSLRARILYKTYTYENNKYAYVYEAVGNSKTYDIKEKYQGLQVNRIGKRAFLERKNLRSINLPKSIKYIEKLAFSECVKLDTINLCDVEYIECNAFSYCTNLNNIELNLKNINASLFYKCESLDTITLKNTEFIYSYAFAYTKIEELDLPETLNSLIGIADYAFYYMDSLKSVKVHNDFLYDTIINNYQKYFNKDGIDIILEV